MSLYNIRFRTIRVNFNRRPELSHSPFPFGVRLNLFIGNVAFEQYPYFVRIAKQKDIKSDPSIGFYYSVRDLNS